MATSSEWLSALAAPALPPVPRWFDALGHDAAFRAGAPFAALDTADGGVAEDAQSDGPLPDQAAGHMPDLADDSIAVLAQAFAEGEMAGRAAAQADAEHAAQHARALRLSFRALDETAMDVLAQELAATVQALCEQVLGEYAIDPHALAARCEAAAARLGGGWQGAMLRLHPDDLAGLAEGALEGWQTTPDPALTRGSLLIESADGAVRDGPEDWRRALAEAVRA